MCIRDSPYTVLHYLPDPHRPLLPPPAPRSPIRSPSPPRASPIRSRPPMGLSQLGMPRESPSQVHAQVHAPANNSSLEAQIQGLRNQLLQATSDQPVGLR
eukprot:TRINITY_DN37220_c0_g1_i1.p1 TRINITY_DN37220_c0_g1~~TRINITY_DN37220_c0_g1_i1.p1  ORF type:complete len:100 (-),score=7.36 TRINITY_DN37220_c0_g1_i1:62-361(-)